MGDSSFKGIQHFPKTLVSHVVTNNCTYNTSKTYIRKCLWNLKDGPRWEELDITSCPAKSPVTNDLIKLSKTDICGENNISGAWFHDAGGCKTPVEVSGNLSQLIKSKENITTPNDIQYTSMIIKKLAVHSTAFLPNNTNNAERVRLNYIYIFFEYVHH